MANYVRCRLTMNGIGSKTELYRAGDDGGMQNLLELGLKYISNIVHYGFSTWYGWHIAKWGTKWNAAETHIVNRDTVEFWTAWSMPEPIFAELSKPLPGR